MAQVRIDHCFSSSTAQVFEYLAEHENLAVVFGACVTRVRDGSDGVRNGVGSTRRVKVGPLPPFEGIGDGVPTPCGDPLPDVARFADRLPGDRS